MLRVVISIAIALAPLCVCAATDPIQAKLEAMQPAQLPESRAHAQYVVYDRWTSHRPRTIMATVVTDEAGTKELVVFRVSRRGALRRLASRDGDPRGVELRDVTGDGKPELLVSAWPGNRGTPVEILRWDGRELTSIGETSASATEVDLDHDGIPELVTHGCCERNACGAVIAPPYVQKLRNGRFESEERANLAEVFVQTKRTSAADTRTHLLILPDTFSTSCVIHVINGTAHGRRRVREVTLVLRTIDDREAEPGLSVGTGVTAATEYLDVPITLPTRCATVEVTLTGPVGATAAFVIDTASVKNQTP